MDQGNEFLNEKKRNIEKLGANAEFKKISLEFVEKSSKDKYSYNFTWLGRPIIQFPQDIVAMQEIIWNVKPDLIIETGIAHGGSLIFNASILELLNNGHVLGIDIDIREHNRKEIESHPLAKRISMIQGSSIDKKVVESVFEFAKESQKILVILDSNHTHEHVFQELLMYSPLVTTGSYLVVFDTIVEDMSEDYEWGSRPWGKGNNPKTAVHEFLKTHKEFEIDTSVHSKLGITVAPDGYLKRVK